MFEWNRVDRASGDGLAGAVPFTLSHPAAVIPLARGRMVPSALVVGSMAPDLPYFFSMGEQRGATHDPLGIVTIDIALGLALFAAFHLMWKRPLVALAPAWARRKLTGPANGFRRSMILWVPPSLLVGTVTHVLWDAFTHRRHSFADAMPWLVTTSVAGLELYRWLQYGSGLLGVMIIAAWLYRWLRRAPGTREAAPGVSARTAAAICGGILICAIAGGTLGSITLINQPDLPRTIHMTLASGVIGTICGGTLALTVYGLAFTLARRRGHRGGSSGRSLPEAGHSASRRDVPAEHS
ncbi:DUF4184 family protein [Actinomadura rugatobispora]|uniref:DUF4184 family protein n=1 Tax=Actinomadura rugatobispora TaxID=1994 RepID=A0ABW1AGT7_9ACTN|nr:DUF4184 family protein [Actinomadura rugatobispora]